MAYALVGLLAFAGMSSPHYAQASQMPASASDPARKGIYTDASPDQVLARVGKHAIRAGELETALASAPFATTFMSMSADDQARARGDMLQRLIGRQLLLLEAQAQGIRDTEAFRNELAVTRTSLLAQASLEALVEDSEPDPQTVASLRDKLSKEPDALEAALASLRAKTFARQKQARLDVLRKRYRLQTHAERFAAAPDALVAEGDGIAIRLEALTTAQERAQGVDTIVLFDRLEQAVETALLARSAEEAGMDVSARLAAYADDLAVQQLLQARSREWLPDEQGQRAWLATHPQFARIPTRWHVGQIVVERREQAEQLRRRIVGGESLFELAGEYSIDAYGRQHAGDMGWLSEGQGMPELEHTLATLADGQVSEVVKTPKGYHLLLVTERRPGRERSFDEMKDAVRQAMVAEKLPAYLASLEARYTVSLN